MYTHSPPCVSHPRPIPSCPLLAQALLVHSRPVPVCFAPSINRYRPIPSLLAPSRLNSPRHAESRPFYSCTELPRPIMSFCPVPSLPVFSCIVPSGPISPWLRPAPSRSPLSVSSRPRSPNSAPPCQPSRHLLSSLSPLTRRSADTSNRWDQQDRSAEGTKCKISPRNFSEISDSPEEPKPSPQWQVVRPPLKHPARA